MVSNPGDDQPQNVTSPSRDLKSRSRMTPSGHGVRVVAAVIAFGALGLLMIAACLRPDASGMGTHRQLGLPTCGWIAAGGVPCPTCGMTTAFSGMATGNVRKAMVAQPMGAMGAILCACVFWGSLHTAVFGSRVGAVGLRLLRPKLVWIIFAAWGLSWVYKIVAYKFGWA